MDVVRLFRNTREWITPVLHESAFTERGVLTPEEFVRAGDQLVLKCPTWSWQSGDKNKVRPYLPADKQFLLIRGCPSYQRVTTMNAATVQDYAVESDLSGVNDKDGDWCAPQIIENSYDDEVLVDAKDFSNEDTDVASSPSATSLSGGNAVESNQGKTERSENDSLQNNLLGSTIPVPDVGKESLQLSDIHLKAAVFQKDKADEYDDMEDESLALDESATTSNLKSSNGSNTNIDSSSSLSHNSKKESALLRSRRYDVSITYDKYYQTPRVWLFGYDENGSPLKPESIFDDIMQDYAKKTVTIDPHPHLSRPHASIHPCQHGPAMLRIIEALNECGNVPVVDSYLFIFLKFIQSVVPTIEYDHTMDVRVRGIDR